MRYENFEPSNALKSLVKEYWVFENDDLTVEQQKIIPDGYSEIIIHYGDPYRINLSGQWETQSRMLFSSQISKFFHLENTGNSGMIGIKLYPTTFNELFQMDVSHLTDRVVPLNQIIPDRIVGLTSLQETNISMEERSQLAEKWLLEQLSMISFQDKIRKCLEMIFVTHGMIDIDQMATTIELSTRQLERLFKKVVGLTPKFYCRIIRFNYIFEVMKEQKDSWIRTALQSGFFDQSHFIKNFKEFTGEEPSNYGFNEVNLANFFLQK